MSSLPLVGQLILTSRPADQNAELSDRLTALGAEVLVQPAIQISDPPDWAPVDQALQRLPSFDWLVFSSTNGVRYLLNRLLSTGADVKQLARLRLAAIGPGTADALAAYDLRVNLVPEKYRAESLAAALAPEAHGKRFLLARASRGREILAEQLVAAGGHVEQVVVYTSTDVQVADDQILAALTAGNIDWVCVTSSAIANSLHAMFGQKLKNSRLASISPVTSATLRKLGYEPFTEATEFTMPGLVAAIERTQSNLAR